VQLRFRDPKYTGPNRCWPCTAINVGVVALVGAALTSLAGVAVALPVVVAALSIVFLRGYLIPGTPRIGRSLPEPVRSWFDSHDPVTERSATEALVAAGVLEYDLSLDPAMDTTIQAQARAYLEDREALEAAVLEQFDAATVSVNSALGGGERWFVLDENQQTVRQWTARSVAALDVAGGAVLEQRLPDWDCWAERDRTAMLALLRYGASACPDCGATFEESDGADVTCCGGRSLVGARRCADCGYPLVDRNDLPTRETEPSLDRSEPSGSGAGL
jgi:hypothetical protein